MPEAPLQPLVTLDLWPHPLTAEGRETRRCAIGPGATLATLAAAEWRGGGALTPAAALDTRPVPMDDWAATPLRGGELVTLRAGLAGGLLGGGDGSNPLSVLLTLAIGFVAPYLAPALGLSGFGAQLFTAGLKLAGGLHRQRALALTRARAARLADPRRARRAGLLLDGRGQPRAGLPAAAAGP